MFTNLVGAKGNTDPEVEGPDVLTDPSVLRVVKTKTT